MSGEMFFILLFVMILCGVLGAAFNAGSGREGLAFFAGFLFGPLGLLAALVMAAMPSDSRSRSSKVKEAMTFGMNSGLKDNASTRKTQSGVEQQSEPSKRKQLDGGGRRKPQNLRLKRKRTRFALRNSRNSTTNGGPRVLTLTQGSTRRLK